MSIITLTAISADRYHVIVYPLNPIRSAGNSKLHSCIIVGFIWTYSFIFAITPSLDIGLSRYVPEGYLTSCSFDYLDKSTKARIFMFTFFVFAWLIPLIIIVYCYVNILRAVKATNQIQSNKKKRSEFKLAIVVVNIIGLWFVAWTPYAIVALFGIMGQEQWLTPTASMIPAIFCKTAACIDPYLYSLTHPRFKMELKRLVRGQQPHPRRISTTKTVVYVSSRRNQDFQMEMEKELSNDDC